MVGCAPRLLVQHPRDAVGGRRLRDHAALFHLVERVFRLREIHLGRRVTDDHAASHGVGVGAELYHDLAKYVHATAGAAVVVLLVGDGDVVALFLVVVNDRAAADPSEPSSPRSVSEMFGTFRLCIGFSGSYASAPLN